MKLKEYSVGETQFDTIKLIFIIAILSVAVAGNFFYSHQPISLRVGGLSLAVVLAGLVAWKTQSVWDFITFFNQAKTEMRKVVWPTQQEILQSTGVVAVFVVIASMILWCLDAMFLKLIGMLTI